ncbi:MAG: hypothetical protein UR39_C0011G0037 [Candidatus Woesebacteria bacterium GW2011_GWA1_33_30]|uniref:Nucleotidyl transferase AbiEii/AbiGii toxin family protein n=1 Tax=Candidatus Woesebacteria bacterium GW2011_GWA2_33_28 TaxID=1618561 RepID=A0A0G0C586_9BACT|nr:MAG: hypothetical protein UR38_C0011G0035 [Candidatus Woesebacteria bacterium GW2011_GWA2_33_28]KKP47085.1 MAG: hypothetical protein UR39_C0011G0037 [Candidatus Woesebacteria bacterium GW2011_GWA1_33_30]KKP48699.1 MAG: hypothetical protein UR40_C0012G0035 [Microgenomates group bacterium GW2011_GWC1_33_32]KKP51408.1 MAG: hypothetical protein UR44_C0011G0035 [Candidatus Woesebacteria bacterium GW2011_GWB1_33_38]
MNMILNDLIRVSGESKRLGMSDGYIKNYLREYLQVFILNFIYSSSKFGDNLIFTGGTCLKHVYDLPRLSEDLDFDVIGKLTTKELADGLTKFFNITHMWKEVTVSVKQLDRQILLKFPCLRATELAGMNDSDLLYVKMDLNRDIAKGYNAVVTVKSGYGMNYALVHYDLPSLFAGKISAVLTRRRLSDYFDLLWFLENKVKPNMIRLNNVLGKKITINKLVELLDQKVDELMTKYPLDLKRDLGPFLQNPNLIDRYITNYKESYDVAKQYLTLRSKK